ncbi:tetratricopeptide repeat protein [Saccharopolyspora sp. NPDC002376]
MSRRGQQAYRLDEAIGLYLETLDTADRVLGPEDRQTLALQVGLGRAYYAADRMDEALPPRWSSLLGEMSEYQVYCSGRSTSRSSCSTESFRPASTASARNLLSSGSGNSRGRLSPYHGGIRSSTWKS